MSESQPKMKVAITLVFLLAACQAQAQFDPNFLKSVALDGEAERLNCESWRLAVETNNTGPWRAVPADCVEYVRNYMTGEGGKSSIANSQYIQDLKTVAMYATVHLNSLSPAANGKDIWVFDIDQTLMNDLPYYRRPDVNFGAIPYNRAKYYEWILKGEQPASEPIQKLYNAILKQGFKIVIMSGTAETYRSVREANLKKVGYGDWEKLIFRTESDFGKYKVNKRSELVEEGYRIVGNVGDQWSDLDGANAGLRIFKLPNPMYYVG